MNINIQYQVATPSLAEQLADSPQVLRELILYMARKVAGAEADGRSPRKWRSGSMNTSWGWIEEP